MSSFNGDLKGVKSSTLLSDLINEPTGETVLAMLKSSFYLPTDILSSPKVTVLPFKTITGRQFYEEYLGKSNVTCDVSPMILVKAKYVGVSTRWINAKSQDVFIVCKLWYGQPLKGSK